MNFLKIASIAILGALTQVPVNAQIVPLATIKITGVVDSVFDPDQHLRGIVVGNTIEDLYTITTPFLGWEDSSPFSFSDSAENLRGTNFSFSFIPSHATIIRSSNGSSGPFSLKLFSSGQYNVEENLFSSSGFPLLNGFISPLVDLSSFDQGHYGSLSFGPYTAHWTITSLQVTIPSAVPEPTTYGMAGALMAIASVIVRRRKSARHRTAAGL